MSIELNINKIADTELTIQKDEINISKSGDSITLSNESNSIDLSSTSTVVKIEKQTSSMDFSIDSNEIVISPTGPQGVQGVAGNDGAGIPTGGTTGQVLAKVDNQDYNTEWVSLSEEQFTYHNGTISTDETWQKSTTHIINGNLNIFATVTVEAGTKIIINDGFSVTVGSVSNTGKFVTLGIPSDLCRIEALGANSEINLGFYFGSLNLRYTELTNIYQMGGYPRRDDGSVYFGNCTFVNCGRLNYSGFSGAIFFLSDCTFIDSKTSFSENLRFAGDFATPKAHRTVFDLGVNTFSANTSISSCIIRGASAVITSNSVGLSINSCLLENLDTTPFRPVLLAYDYAEVTNSILISETVTLVGFSGQLRESVILENNIISTRSTGNSALSSLGVNWLIKSNLFLGHADSTIAMFGSNISNCVIENNSFLAKADLAHISNFGTSNHIASISNNVLGNSTRGTFATQSIEVSNFKENIFWNLSNGSSPNTQIDSNIVTDTQYCNTSQDPLLEKQTGNVDVFLTIQEDFGEVITSDIPDILKNLMNKYRIYSDTAYKNDIGQSVRATADVYTTPSPITIQSDYSAGSEEYIFVDAVNNNINISLPYILGCSIHKMTIKRIDSSSNTVTVTANGSDLIDGQSSITLTTTGTQNTVNIVNQFEQWRLV